MSVLKRPAIDRYEVLVLADCPSCGGDIEVGDCGYSTFNCGHAECAACKRRWNFAIVEDRWDAGRRWNAKAKAIEERLKLLSLLKVESNPDFGRVIEVQAEKFLDELKKQIIGGEVGTK